VGFDEPWFRAHVLRKRPARLDLAAANHGFIDPSQFAIITNVGPLRLTGQVQEFIIRTPEPGTLALLLCGLFAVALLASRQRIART